MDPALALQQLGGLASTADLLHLTTEKKLRTALAHDRIRKAIAGRDPGLAATASEAHLANAEAWLRTAMRDGGDADEWSVWLES